MNAPAPRLRVWVAALCFYPLCALGVETPPAAENPASSPKPAANRVVITPITAPTAPPVPDANGNILLDGGLSPEERARRDLLANAQRLNLANQELLTRNQSLLLQNENLKLQLLVLQEDRSAEGIRNGALAVLAGLFVGWLLAGRRSQKTDRSWS